MACLARDMVIANTFGSAALLIIFLLGGFILPKGECWFLSQGLLLIIIWNDKLFLSGMIKPWWVWAFWVSPLSYGQRAISVNEFTATRWTEVCSLDS